VSAARGSVVAVCVGPGGIPKHPVPSAHVGVLGLAGDAQRQRFHGGANRAVCILSVAEVRSIERDGVRGLVPGSFGENLLIDGLDFGALRPGDRLAIGDEVVIEVHGVREPCGTLRPLDRRFPDLMAGRSGFVCKVVREGRVANGDAVAVLARAGDAALDRPAP
jgi:MOSC domain-containing protein YiiM